MFNLFKKALNCVKSTWNKFKNFVKSMFKKRPVKKEVTYNNSEKPNNTKKQETIRTDFERPSARPITRPDTTSEKETIRTDFERTEIKNENLNKETIIENEEENLEQKEIQAADILIEATKHSVEELNFAILSIVEDEEQNTKLNSALKSKTMASNFATNFINARRKITNKIPTKNQIVKAVREGKFFTNEKYRNEFAECLNKGLLKLHF